MATIRITNLKLRTIIGTNDWERVKKQNVVVNVALDYDASRAVKSDKLNDTIDYKTITKNIIKTVQGSKFFLLEKLTHTILKIVMENPKVHKATVRVDKPLALRYADSVSVKLSQTRKS